MQPPTIVKHDTSPVADLKRPFKTRLYRNSAAAGTIDLAYERGLRAGVECVEAEMKKMRRLLMRCHIYAEDGMGGSASYAMDRLFQINKLTRKFVKE